MRLKSDAKLLRESQSEDEIRPHRCGIGPGGSRFGRAEILPGCDGPGRKYRGNMEHFSIVLQAGLI
jgi:hypothetical protein